MKSQFPDSVAHIVGDTNIWVGDKISPAYLRDGLRVHRGFLELPESGITPDIVVSPATTDEVSRLVRLCVEKSIPIVPYGGGTGLMGGAIASRGGLTLDMRRMNKALEVDEDQLFAKAQSGIVLEDLVHYLAQRGLVFGHDPWSRPQATLGGAIATDGLGYCASKRGSMGDQVLGLEVVLPNGEVLRTRAIPKSSTGLNLNRLFIGTEGTLGIITEAAVRVFPGPEKQILRGYSFASFERGFEALVKLFRIGLVPMVFEYGETYLSEQKPCVSELFLSFEGLTEEVDVLDKRAEKLFEQFDAKDMGSHFSEKFWKKRHRAIGSYKIEKDGTMAVDKLFNDVKFDYIHVAVPTSKVLEYRGRCLEILHKHSVHPIEIGFWVRPEFFSIAMRKPIRENPAKASKDVSIALHEMLSLAQDFQGSMEYCHGVGLRLANLMSEEHGVGLDIMRTIKKALDPKQILNPGKLGLV